MSAARNTTGRTLSHEVPAPTASTSASTIRRERKMATAGRIPWITSITAHAEVCPLLVLQTGVNTRGRFLSRAIAALRSLLITPVAPKYSFVPYANASGCASARVRRDAPIHDGLYRSFTGLTTSRC